MLIEIYCEEVQSVAVAHSRLEVDVGAVVWYSLDVQVISGLQTRSDMVMKSLIVGAVDSYCELVHAVSGAQTVFSVVAVGFVEYAVDAHVVFVVQLLSE
jgi:hypothetical protein